MFGLDKDCSFHWKICQNHSWYLLCLKPPLILGESPQPNFFSMEKSASAWVCILNGDFLKLWVSCFIYSPKLSCCLFSLLFWRIIINHFTSTSFDSFLTLFFISISKYVCEALHDSLLGSFPHFRRTRLSCRKMQIVTYFVT